MIDPQHRPFWELAASIVHGRFPSEFCITHPNAQQREIIAALVAARNLGQADYRHHLADIQATGLSVLIREGEPNRLCAPKGHVLTDDGEVIGVLGELPLTADRKLIGFGAEAIMYSGSSASAFSNIGFGDEPRQNNWTHNWYSTPSAAQSAQGASRE